MWVDYILKFIVIEPIFFSHPLKSLYLSLLFAKHNSKLVVKMSLLKKWNL